MDFLDIPMDGFKELNELDDYLSQAVEKVHDPIAWWWDNRKVYPRLLVMALDYLSVPGESFIHLVLHPVRLILVPAMSTAVECLFSQG